jgi:hypothetical protein
VDPDTITTIIVSSTNVPVIFWLVYMFVSGKIHSDSEFDRVNADLETERHAHDLTRASLMASYSRADTGISAAQVIAQAFEEAKKRKGDSD